MNEEGHEGTEDMHKFRIENSDRGVTFNKNLAWTIFSAAVAAVFWFASTITNIQAVNTSQNDALSAIQKAAGESDAKTDARIVALTARFTENEGRFRKLEEFSARTAAQYEALGATLKEMKEGQVRAESLLTQLIKDSAR